MPCPVTLRNVPCWQGATPCSCNHLTTASAKGCSDWLSRCNSKGMCRSAFAWLLHATSVTSGLPSVMVPVLSNTTAVTLHSCSKLSASRINMLFSAPFPIPTIIAVGVAKPKAQGQAITNTVTEVSSACAKSPSANIHTAKVKIASPITTGTKIPAILSTNFCTGALLPCASCTIRIICASTVSLPTFSAIKRKLPF